MAGDNADGEKWSSIAATARAFGLGGVLLIAGFALIGLAIYEGPKFTDHETQVGVLVTGLIGGLLAIGFGVYVLRGGFPAVQPGPRPPIPAPEAEYDIFLAAPMAGFGSNDADRTAMNDLVGKLNAALGRLEGVKNVHTPVLTRPDPKKFEDPAVGFAVEFEALINAKRYLLLLPKDIPAGTSVLLTAGMAIALKLPAAILAVEGSRLPYLLDGAAKNANVHLYYYKDTGDIEQLINNNGLRLFTGSK